MYLVSKSKYCLKKSLFFKQNMTLSLDKLQYFLNVNHFTPRRYFLFQMKCILIECISTKTLNSFMLSIPSNYDFRITNEEYVYELEKIPVSSLTEDMSDFAHTTEHVMESHYQSIEAHVQLPNHHKRPIKDHLDDFYKHEVLLKNMSKEDSILLKDMYRQLQRLKYCILGMQHTIALMKSHYVVYLDTNHDIHVYLVKRIISKETSSFYVAVDFDIFYDKANIIDTEISSIYKGIWKVLNNNQDKHIRNIQEIIDRKSNILERSEHLSRRKQSYLNYIDKYTSLLSRLEDTNTELNKELDELKVSTNNELHTDLKRVHYKQKVEKKIHKLIKTKKEVITILEELHSKNQDLTLTIDTILFDNIIMLDKIFTNFDKFNKLDKEN